MSGYQQEPDPFSREAAGPGNGLGDSNRFDTWADGSTPAGQQLPGSAPSAADPNGFGAPAAQPSAPDSASSFPTYPYGQGADSGYADPQVDEAYAAFQGYQASTPQPSAPYPDQQVMPYQGYQAGYGVPYGGYARQLPNSPYATPAIVLGLVGLMCGVTAPIGVGFGIAALKQINAEPQSYGGKGLAITGIVSGGVVTLLGFLTILSMLVS